MQAKSLFPSGNSNFPSEKPVFPREKLEFPSEIHSFLIKNGPAPSRKLVALRYGKHMATLSFRDILLQFLEEKRDENATSPSVNAENSAVQHDFHWQAPDSVGKRRSTYQAPTPKAKPAARPQPPLEPQWNLSKFSAEERECVTKLIGLGAFELRGRETLSRSILKSAHRRLVKLHHPDVLLKVVNQNERERRKEIFLGMQKAYETLNARIGQLNAEASGNGSASAEASPHQDAA